MPVSVSLRDMPDETSFAPLGVLGYCLTRTRSLEPVWAELELSLKTVDHCPQAKLQDILVSILSGCRAIVQVNKCMAGQEALVLMTDIAHNLLAWVPHWMFPGEPLASFGTTRLIEDVFHLPGCLLFQGERLLEVQLNRLHPYAQPVASGLERLLSYFGWP